MANKEITNVTGLESSTNFEQDEKSLVMSLLEAADYRTSNEGSTRTINVKNANGKVLFSFTIRGLSQSEYKRRLKRQQSRFLIQQVQNILKFRAKEVQRNIIII